MVDASWALAADGEGGFDRHVLFGSSAVQYVMWVSGTVVGVIGGSALGDPKNLGLDAIYPAFFLALMIAEIRSGRALGVAAAGALIAFALIPVTPRGRPGPGRLARVAARAHPAVEREHAARAVGLIAACAIVTAAIKGVGPVALGGRELPSWFSAIVAMMAPALFAALVVTQALADGREWAIGADTAGVALAGRRGVARRVGDRGRRDRGGDDGGAARA